MCSILSERDAQHFENDELYQLGIHAVKVELDEEDVLEFEPCFFLPQFSKSLLTDYPIRENDRHNICLAGENYEHFDFQYHREHRGDLEEGKRHFKDAEMIYQTSLSLMRDYVERHLEAYHEGIDSEVPCFGALAPIDVVYVYLLQLLFHLKFDWVTNSLIKGLAAHSV